MTASAAAPADEHWMRLAHQVSQEAFDRGDWPAGAAIVAQGRCLGTGQNRQVSAGDPTQHAETDAIRAAIAANGAQALRGATLYSTMEPCPMCAAALRLAGVSRVVSSLRMAEMGRKDLGGYSLEAFCRLLGWQPDLDFGVLHGDCLELRKRWGGDSLQSKGEP